MPILKEDRLGSYAPTPEEEIRFLEQSISEGSKTEPSSFQSSFDEIAFLEQSIAEDERAVAQEEPGFASKAVSVVGGGLLGAGETWGRFIRGLPGGQEAGVGREGVSGTILKTTEKLREYLPEEPKDPGSIYQGVRSAVTSVTSRLPQIAAGAALGTAVGGPVGTFIGALGGYVLGGAPVFGLAQYDEFIENAVNSDRYKQGKITRDEIEKGAITSGLHETGWEYASDILTGAITLATGGLSLTAMPVKEAGMKTIKEFLKGIFKTSGKQMLKRATAIIGGEVTTEMATAGFQTEELHKLGLTDQRFMDGVKQAFGPSFVASLIFAGFFEGGIRLNLKNQNKNILKDLENPKTPIEQRKAAVNLVGAEMEKVSPEAYEMWSRMAGEAINNNEPITLDNAKIDELSKTYENRLYAPERQAELDRQMAEYETEPTPASAESRQAEINRQWAMGGLAKATPMTTIAEETTNIARTTPEERQATIEAEMPTPFKTFGELPRGFVETPEGKIVQRDFYDKYVRRIKSVFADTKPDSKKRAEGVSNEIIKTADEMNSEDYVKFWETNLNQLDYLRQSPQGIERLRTQLASEEEAGNIQPEYAEWWAGQLDRIDQVRQSIIGAEGLKKELAAQERKDVLMRTFGMKPKKPEAAQEIVKGEVVKEVEKAEAVKEPSEKIVPFSERTSAEKKTIEEYNKKMTPTEWKKEYAKHEPHYIEETKPSPLADEMLRDLKKDGVDKGNILEIGVGNGRDSIYLAKKGHNIKGIDVVEKAVETAKKAIGKTKNVSFEVGKAEALQYENESFDAVYSIAALHATPIKFTFSEVYRVLKPGGQAKLFLYTRTKTGDKWVSYWTPGEIKQYAEEAGFKIKKFREGHDTEPIDIPDIKGKVEQETHLVITTLRKPKVAPAKPQPAALPAEKPSAIVGLTIEEEGIGKVGEKVIDYIQKTGIDKNRHLASKIYEWGEKNNYTIKQIDKVLKTLEDENQVEIYKKGENEFDQLIKLKKPAPKEAKVEVAEKAKLYAGDYVKFKNSGGQEFFGDVKGIQSDTDTIVIQPDGSKNTIEIPSSQIVALEKGGRLRERDEQAKRIAGMEAKRKVEIETTPEGKEVTVEESIARIKASTTDILKGERGSFSFETKKGAATFEDFKIVGRDFIQRGADTFNKFIEQMRQTFGEAWESIKHLAKEIYDSAKAALVSERGAVTLREGVVKPLTAVEKALGLKVQSKTAITKKGEKIVNIPDENIAIWNEIYKDMPKLKPATHAKTEAEGRKILASQELTNKLVEKLYQGKFKDLTLGESYAMHAMHVNQLNEFKTLFEGKLEDINQGVQDFRDKGIGRIAQAEARYHGQMLNAQKIKLSPQAAMRAFANLEREIRPQDKEMYNAAVKAQLNGNDRPMIQFIKYLEKTNADPKIMDYVYEYWYNSILSGIPTNVVNVATNTSFMAWQLGVHKPLLAMLDPLVAKFQKRQTEYYFAEIIPALAGVKRGFKPGAKGAKEVLIKGYTTDAMTDKFELEIGKSMGAFSRSPNKYLRALAPFLTIPTKLLRGADIWAKQIAYQAELGSIAMRMEKKGEGTYAELLQNPTEDMMNQASEFADYVTFMNKLGKIGSKIESLRGDIPGGRFVVPFVRTIANLVKRGIELTPGVGALKLLGGKVKGAEVTQVLVKQIEGAMIALVIASMFDDDEITGDVPADKAEREAFYRQGKLPWSIKIGDKWLSYRRIEPFNTPIAAIGILYDTWKRTGEEPSTELAWRTAAGVVNNIIDSSYLSGLTQTLDAVRQADKWPDKLNNMFDRTIASFSPMSSFQRSFVRAIEAMDKEGAVVRKPKGAWETLKAATPLASETIPARKNVWGEDIVIPGSPLAQWLPWKAAKVSEDKVEKEIERLHRTGLMAYPGMPAKYMSIAGKKLDFDDKQYDMLVSESGKSAKIKLDQLVDTSYWKMLSDKEKASRIEKIIQSNRKKARNKIKREIGIIPGLVSWKKRTESLGFAHEKGQSSLGFTTKKATRQESLGF